MTLLLAFLIGFFTGLRTFTPVAVTAWAVRLGWIKLTYPLSLIGSVPAAVILTLFALGELWFDKSPKASDRTSAPGLIGRFLMGALAGACVAVAEGQGALIGAGLGAAGGIVGAFAGYHARKGIVNSLGVRDIYVALTEDFIAIAGCWWIVSHL